MNTPAPPPEIPEPQEKCLWDIYKTYRKIHGINRFNLIISIISLCFISFSIGGYDGSLSDLRSYLSSCIDIQIQVIASFLGFFIAGYTIFLSLIKTEEIKLLSQLKIKKANISQFKSFNYLFINVFIQFLVCFIFIHVLKFVIIPNSGFSRLAHLLFEEEILLSLFKSLTIIILLWSVILALYLKSFIWNLYDSVMMILEMSSGTEQGS